MKHTLKFALALTLAFAMVFSTAMTALAAECADLDFSQTGSVTVTLTAAEDGSQPTDGTLTIYRVATLYLDDGNMAYALDEDFSTCEVDLSDVTAADLAAQLSAYVEENQLQGASAEISDGTATFTALTLGLYLVEQTQDSTGFYTVESFVVTVPMDSGDSWTYDVDASPKAEILVMPEEEPDDANDEEADDSDDMVAQTGQIFWPIVYCAIGGAVLVCAGFVLTRKPRHTPRHEK